MNLTIKQAMGLAQFVKDFEDKNILPETMEEKYGFATGWLNTEQAIHSYLIYEGLIDVKDLWTEDLYDVFSGQISDDGWLTSSWGTVLERELSRFDDNYQYNPKYTDTYSRMYLMDFTESCCGKYVRPIISDEP